MLGQGCTLVRGALHFQLNLCLHKVRVFILRFGRAFLIFGNSGWLLGHVETARRVEADPRLVREKFASVVLSTQSHVTFLLDGLLQSYVEPLLCLKKVFNFWRRGPLERVPDAVLRDSKLFEVSTVLGGCLLQPA